jgi:pathogenesis-related protein 1
MFDRTVARSLALALGLSFVACSSGEPIPGGGGSGGTPGTGNETGPFVGTVAAHNSHRAAVGSPPLAWSSELAAYAQNWANTLATSCSIRHSGGRYGENIAAYGSSGAAPLSTPQRVVSSWAQERTCWTYGRFMQTDQCSSSCVASLNSNGCGHYTQVVWRNTARVGCGRSTCRSGSFNWEYWVCNYDPPGNFIGQTPY